MTRELADDLVEAVRLAGSEAHAYPLSRGSYGVSIGNLPDVRRFIRALDHLGISGTVVYSAGSGWSVEP